MTHKVTNDAKQAYKQYKCPYLMPESTKKSIKYIYIT